MHAHVTIIGLDRLGTSFGLALKRYQNQRGAEHTFTIVGSDPRGFAMKTAQKMDAVDNFHRALLKASENADLIIMNAPFSDVEEMYRRLGPELKPGAVILDMSTLKMPVIDWAQRYLSHNDAGEPLAYMVGITPMVNANALYKGDLTVEGAQEDLFDDVDILIAPSTDTPSEALALTEDVVRLVGGKPRFMDPLEHDGLIAASEELPALLGAVLFYMLKQTDGWMELRRMVNPTLALATQNLRYQRPDDLFALFIHNRDNLARHLEGLIGVLDQVRDSLVSGEEGAEELEGFLEVVQKTWEQWDIKRHSGKWEDAKDLELLPGPFGSASGFLSMRRRGKDEDDED
jgi:prephenate dehydrogenase